MFLSPAELQEEVTRNTRLGFSRSGGPGGQNVNKRSTKVTARLRISDLDCLSEEQKNRVRSRLAGRMNTEDELVIQVDEERLQGRNRNLALTRLVHLLERSLRARKKRKPTRPSAASRERRLTAKKHQAEKKKQRQRRAFD